MYKELWVVTGIKRVRFVNADGETVKGNQVFYSRSFYDEREKENWLWGYFSPNKPQWVSDDLAAKLVNSLKCSEKNYVYACYEPKGRFNALSGFEVCSDDVINIDDIDLDT